MKKFFLNFAILSLLILFSLIVLQSFDSKDQYNFSEEVTVKCRKSSTSGDYCYSGGKTIMKCANNTEINDCDQSNEEVPVED